MTESGNTLPLPVCAPLDDAELLDDDEALLEDDDVLLDEELLDEVPPGWDWPAPAHPQAVATNTATALADKILSMWLYLLRLSMCRASQNCRTRGGQVSAPAYRRPCLVRVWKIAPAANPGHKRASRKAILRPRSPASIAASAWAQPTGPRNSRSARR